MEIQEGFEQYYPAHYIWMLLRRIYRLKQAAIAFCMQLILAFASMNYHRSKADPCLYFDWTIDGLIVCISWVNDCLVAGKKPGVLIAKGQMTARLDCEETGEVDKKYVGCKQVERNYKENLIKLTQPVMLQSFIDEFNLPNGPAPNTPATPGDALIKADPKDCIPADELCKGDEASRFVGRPGLAPQVGCSAGAREDAAHAAAGSVVSAGPCLEIWDDFGDVGELVVVEGSQKKAPRRGRRA
jgi:hypothetical protein